MEAVLGPDAFSSLARKSASNSIDHAVCRFLVVGQHDPDLGVTPNRIG